MPYNASVFCKACRYSLANLTEHRCPECGRGFDPDDAATFLASADRRVRHWIVFGVTVAGLLWALLFGYCFFFVDDLWPARPWNRPTLPTWYLIRSFLIYGFVTWMLTFTPALFLTLLLRAIVEAVRAKTK